MSSSRGASGGTAPANCILRIAPGTTVFEASYYYTVKSLTGGLESIAEIETPRQGSGIGFATMFYPDQLPPGLEPINFDYWSVPAHKSWRFHLADPPTAEEVDQAHTGILAIVWPRPEPRMQRPTDGC